MAWGIMMQSGPIYTQASSNNSWTQKSSYHSIIQDTIWNGIIAYIKENKNKTKNLS